MKSKVLSVLLLFGVIISFFNVTAIAYQTKSDNFSKNYSLTGNHASDIVAVANAQLGKNQSNLGYTEAWCADFVMDCARLTNMLNSIIPYDYAAGANVTNLYNRLINNCGATVVSNRQPGDLLFYYCNKCGVYKHVAVVMDGTYSIEGNYWINNVSQVAKASSYWDDYNHSTNDSISRVYVRPKYETSVLENPVNLGTNFYAYIMSKEAWKPIVQDNDENVTLRTETGMQNQMWQFVRLDDGSYKIVSLKNGKCLDVDSAGTNNGTNVKVCDWFGNDAQKWYIYGESDNYKLKSKCNNLVLDLSGGYYSDGTNVQMWEDNNTSAQKFQIYNLDNVFALGKPIDLGNEFYAYIMNKETWKPITQDDNENVVLRTETGYQNQVWKFERLDDGSYKIISLKNKKCLDVYIAGTNNGTNVSVCDWFGNDAQKWYIYGESDNYKLKSKCNNLVLDLSGGSFSDGTNVQMWEYNNTLAQKFQIYKLDVGIPEITDINIIIEDNLLNLQVMLSSMSENTDVWMAIYNESDELLDAKKSSIKVLEQRPKFTFDNNNAKYVKVFLWKNGTMTPLSESMTKEIN